MNKPKTIVVVCNYNLNPNRIGGMDRFFKAYNESLKEQGHQVYWIFSGGGHFEFYSDFNLQFARHEGLEEKALDFLKTKKSVDLVVTHFVALCTLFYKEMKKLEVKKTIAVDHNPRPLKGFSLKKRLKNKIKGFFYGKYVDAFVGVSHYTKKHIIKDYGQHLKHKTFVIHNGIDHTKYIQKDALQRKNSKFVVVSHLRFSKGIQDLISAVALLSAEKRKNFSIDIFGEGPYEQELKNLVQKYALENIFNFCGSSSALPQKLHEYDYLLQPTHMECFSLSLLESVAANVPVITTTVGGNLELIEDGKNGFIFEPQDIQALTKILTNILDEKMAIEADVYHIIKNQFSLEKMLDEHLKISLCT